MWPGIGGSPVQVVFSVGELEAELVRGLSPAALSWNTVWKPSSSLNGNSLVIQVYHLVYRPKDQSVYCILGMHERTWGFNIEPDPLTKQTSVDAKTFHKKLLRNRIFTVLKCCCTENSQKGKKEKIVFWPCAGLVTTVIAYSDLASGTGPRDVCFPMRW